MKNTIMPLTLIVLLTCCAFSHADNPNPPEKIALDAHASGNHQCGMHGKTLPKPLRVVVTGPLRPGLLGGKGSHPSVPDVDVQFTVLNPESGAFFAESGTSEMTCATDAAGQAAATLTLGNKTTDVFVRASIETPKGVKGVQFRAVSGLEIIGSDLECPAGGTLPPVGVRIQDNDGSPAIGLPVLFRLENGDNGAALSAAQVQTDEKGQALTSWTLGSKTGQYFLLVHIDDNRPTVAPDQRIHIRPIELNAMALDKKQMAVVLFGGLAIFILGMKTMSGGLKRMADRRLKSILEAVTRNRFMAIGVGALLTALIQSSSATSVMTVGFVNAGLISLKQAIGVIFGANIGTTITAQIIAFKLDALAYPAIAVGLIVTALAKKPTIKASGEAILGFGLLFLGMETMSSVLKPLKHSPEFISLFRYFDCSPLAAGGMVQPLPALMCILIGTVTTCVIQSSSATVGLVLALSSQGLVSFYTAVPLIIGDNIGTTITALLASIGTNRNARRAAVAHTLFNVFGAIYMYALLFVPLWNGKPLFLGFVDAITPGEVFTNNPENLLRHVANSHTAFNILNCVLFLPFIGSMAKVCNFIVPVTDEDKETLLEYLEPHLLDAPPVAIEQAIKEVAYMVRRTQKSIDDACDYFTGGATQFMDNVTRREEIINRLQKEITQYLVDLSHRNLRPAEAALIPALIHAVNDAERIGDHCKSICELGAQLRIDRNNLSAQAIEDVRAIQSLLNEQTRTVHEALLDSSLSNLDNVQQREDKLDHAILAASENHVHRLEKGECDVQAGILFLDSLTHFERIGDHLVNILERVTLRNYDED